MRGAHARFNEPAGVTVGASGHIVVADSENHALRRVSASPLPSSVRTDGQGAAARVRFPRGLARDKGGSILVADRGNNAVRRVTMAGAVSTVAGNGEAGYATARARLRASITHMTW